MLYLSNNSIFHLIGYSYNLLVYYVSSSQQVVQKTAATFAPRASTATKNPAVPGTALYTIFEVQGYASMLIGGALSFNLIFPSNEPDLWRLMGMWSIWMFSKLCSTNFNFKFKFYAACFSHPAPKMKKMVYVSQ